MMPRQRTIVALAGLFFVCYSVHAMNLGIDVLEDHRFKELEGRRIALITNQTGRNKKGDSTVDILAKAKKVTLVSILSPEHGFRGTAEHGQAVSDEKDLKTGVPVYSLYGKTTRPTAAMLNGVNTIVFDIQDIGTRFYTYIATMGQAMEEAARTKRRFVVLDRPNPIRGDQVDGDILDPDIKRMTGYFPIPVRHGLTVGEIAQWMNKTQNLKADLVVIRMEKWKRDQWFETTGLEFIPPSPNIPSVSAAFLYSGIGAIEATNVAVGRGTGKPFEMFGAPWVNGKELCSRLRQFNLPGLLFEPVEFTPTKDIYAGEICRGVHIIVTDRNKARPFEVFIISFLFFAERYAKFFRPEWEEVRVVTGSNKLRQASERVLGYDDLMKSYSEALATFQSAISSFYLY